MVTTSKDAIRAHAEAHASLKRKIAELEIERRRAEAALMRELINAGAEDLLRVDWTRLSKFIRS